MLTQDQVDRVQDSFALVLPQTADVAADFYQRLFEVAPETRALFKHDMGDQGRKLFLTLAAVVDALDDLERVLPTAQALAVRHVDYGVQDCHYAAVGASLLAALGSALGSRFDADTAEAWAAAYAILAGVMQDAARRGSDALVSQRGSLGLEQAKAA